MADKEKYQIGDTAHILVTSPFSPGHRPADHRARPPEALPAGQPPGRRANDRSEAGSGDLPDVYAGLTLLGPERRPPGPPTGATMWPCAPGYVDLSLDTSSKQLQVSLEPQGQGPFAPGTTATMTVHTRDSSGQPAPGELSLAVVDEAIYALAGRNGPDLFGTFWGERGIEVTPLQL